MRLLLLLDPEAAYRNQLNCIVGVFGGPDPNAALSAFLVARGMELETSQLVVEEVETTACATSTEPRDYALV